MLYKNATTLKYIFLSEHLKTKITYINIYARVSIYIRSSFKRVANITKEEQEKQRVVMVAETLTLGLLNEDVRLASEEEIALANINKNKQESADKRKARKVMQCVSNTISGVPTGAKAKTKDARKKKKLAK